MNDMNNFVVFSGVLGTIALSIPTAVIGYHVLFGGSLDDTIAQNDPTSSSTLVLPEAPPQYSQPYGPFQVTTTLPDGSGTSTITAAASGGPPDDDESLDSTLDIDTSSSPDDDEALVSTINIATSSLPIGRQSLAEIIETDKDSAQLLDEAKRSFIEVTYLGSALFREDK